MFPDAVFGVLLPTREVYCGEWRADQMPAFAVEAEELGFESVWAGDALASARLEPLAVLASVAAVTRRVLLGTAAMTPALRRPVIAAHQVATLDALSGGRVVLTVGAGFPERIRPQLAAAGVDYRTRYSLLDDIVGCWRHLWAGGHEYDGALLHYRDLPDAPAPARPDGPPIWLAGATPANLRRAGRLYDGWMPYPPDPGAYAQGLEMVRDHARGTGRDPSLITPSLYATVLVEERPNTARPALEAYCQAFYGAPLEYVETIQVFIAGSAEQVRDELGRFVAAGARHVVLRIAALRPGEDLERLATTLLSSRVAP
jgi:alkanesulfonate monooxygenase SsuD/methylene tetrahydromethanopterin reductase-like flavin-dependent oxidoreductase (luciferase family)